MGPGVGGAVLFYISAVPSADFPQRFGPIGRLEAITGTCSTSYAGLMED